MRLYFSRKVTATGAILVALMLCASYWQWTRYQSKQDYIAILNKRVEEPVIPLLELAEQDDWEQAIHRRVEVAGEYDFEHEVVLRNRRYEGDPGVFVITPLRIAGSERYVLVNRGFLPLSFAGRTARQRFHEPSHAHFTGLVKERMHRRPLSPKDPEAGRDLPWVDAWLRVDVEEIQKQLPYPVLPIYLEIMESENGGTIAQRMVKSSSGKDDILFLPSDGKSVAVPKTELDRRYPVPVFDTVVPAGRHLQYVFEWAFMALMTVFICTILQLRPPRQR